MTTTTTALDLDAIKARADAATSGPWDLIGDDEIGLGVEKRGVGYSYDVALVQVASESDRLDDLAHNPNRSGITLGAVKADAEFIAHARQDVPALIAELEQARRGGKELGKNVIFLMELIKDAFVRGADDPIGALNMLGNVVAEVFEDEGGLSPDEFNRVQRALDARESEEETRLREGDERRRVEVSRSLADIAHAQRPLTEHERAFQDGV